MESAKEAVTSDVMLEIFKRTMPFQVVSDGMLRKIAALCWQVNYPPGTSVYVAGDKADDLYIIVSGKIEHTLEPGVNARRPLQTLGAGDVFGWAALMDKFPHRLARAKAVDAVEIVRINGD